MENNILSSSNVFSFSPQSASSQINLSSSSGLQATPKSPFLSAFPQSPLTFSNAVNVPKREVNSPNQFPQASTSNESVSPRVISKILCPNGCGTSFTRPSCVTRHLKQKICKGSPDTALSKQIAETRAENDVVKLENKQLQLELTKLRKDQQFGQEYSTLKDRQKRRRRSLLFDETNKIAVTPSSAGELLWDVLEQNYGEKFFQQKILKYNLSQKIGKCEHQVNMSLLLSRENCIRTSKVIFQNGQKMSTRVFAHVKGAVESIDKSGVPLLNYKSTIGFLRREIKYIRGELTSALELVDSPDLSVRLSGDGRYRSLKETARRMANKFLRAGYKEKPTISFKWCSEEFVFHLGIGADAFPLYDKAVTAFSLSILDLGSIVHSPDGLSLLFVGDFDEGHDACLQYCRQISTQMRELENSQYQCQIEDRQIEYKFKFSAFSGDQCLHCKVVGQGSCSSTFFNPYVSARKDKGNNQLNLINATVGREFFESTYERRVDFAEKVAKFRTKYIADNGHCPDDKIINAFVVKIGTSQKLHPPIGWMSDFVYGCSLHLGINAMRCWFKGFVTGFISELSKFVTSKGVTCPDNPMPKLRNSLKFRDLEREHTKLVAAKQTGIPIVCLVEALRQMKLKRVSNLIEKMVNEKATDLGQFRLTGDEVRMFCHRGPWLTGLIFRKFLDSLNFNRDSVSEMITLRQRLAFSHFTSILLRNILSLINRTEITENELSIIETLCRYYQNISVAVAKSSAFDKYHNQSVWNLAIIGAFHSRKIYTNLNGKSLGLVSMQGREHMHQTIKTLLRTTNQYDRWGQVFEYHEICSNYLPEEFNEVGIKYQKQHAAYCPISASDIDYLDIICELKECQVCSDCKKMLHKAADTGVLTLKRFAKIGQ